MPRFVPSEMTGLWRRQSMRFPDGRVDATTCVLWLQTRELFADIRIPADRPDGGSRRSFADYDDAALVALAAMQGFAGRLTVEGDLCRWHRELDFEPPGGSPDEARFDLAGDRLVERGLHADYVETWRRETGSDGPLLAFRLAQDAAMPGRAGILVIAGDHFVEIRDRAAPLPPATSLAPLVEADLAGGDRAAAVARLEMRVVAGRVASGTIPWEVTLATLPWLEGAALGTGLAFEPGTGILSIAGADPAVWRLADADVPAGAIGRFFERSLL